MCITYIHILLTICTLYVQHLNNICKQSIKHTITIFKQLFEWQINQDGLPDEIKILEEN